MAEEKVTPAQKIEALEAENAELKAIVADMQEKLDEAAAKASKAPDVVVAKVGKNSYEVVTGAIVPGIGRLSAKELAEHKEALATVLKIEGQTILKAL